MQPPDTTSTVMIGAPATTADDGATGLLAEVFPSIPLPALRQVLVQAGGSVDGAVVELLAWAPGPVGGVGSDDGRERPPTNPSDNHMSRPRGGARGPSAPRGWTALTRRQHQDGAGQPGAHAASARAPQYRKRQPPAAAASAAQFPREQRPTSAAAQEVRATTVERCTPAIASSLPFSMHACDMSGEPVLVS